MAVAMRQSIELGRRRGTYILSVYLESDCSGTKSVAMHHLRGVVTTELASSRSWLALPYAPQRRTLPVVYWSRCQVYFVYEMALIVWKERVFEALKERLRNNTIRVVNAARERNLPDLDDNDVVKSLLKT